jgi:hypothetical protein
MVTRAAAYLEGLLAVDWTGAVTLAQQAKQLPIDRLDPLTRAKVLSALAGLIILMFGLMLLAWLGARWARHYANRPPILFEDRQKKRSWSEDDWASKPLVPPDSDPDEEP